MTYYCLQKREINRIRHVNELKRIANNSDDHKLVYAMGGNLVLMKKKRNKWVIVDETGPWFEFNLFEGYLQ